MRLIDSSPAAPLCLQPVKSANGSLRPEFLRDIVSRFRTETFLIIEANDCDFAREAQTLCKQVHVFARAESNDSTAAGTLQGNGEPGSRLEQVLSSATGPVCMWLDPLGNCEPTDQSFKRILEYLAVVRRSGRTDVVILIDDLQYLVRDVRPTPDQQPCNVTANDLHRAVLDVASDYQFFAYGDVGMAIPAAENKAVSDIVQALTISRLYDGNNLPIEEVISAETVIGSAAGTEREAIFGLCSMTSVSKQSEHGHHYRLWRAISLVGENRMADAVTAYRDLIRDGFQHWRAWWYLAVAMHLTGNHEGARDALIKLVGKSPEFLPAQVLLASIAAQHSAPAVAKTETQVPAKSFRVIRSVSAARAGEFDNDNPETNGEFLVVRSLIKSGNVVFDVGANVGDWTKAVLTAEPNVTVYAFEPAPATFQTLQRTVAGPNVRLNNFALADRTGDQALFCFNDRPEFCGMNSFFRRPGVEQRLHIHGEATVVAKQTLDAFLVANDIKHIDFLKIDTEGAELSILRGASNALCAGRIKLVQIEYGGTYSDAGISLREVYDYLVGFGYRICRIVSNGLIPVDSWDPALENFKYTNYLAVAKDAAASLLDVETATIPRQQQENRRGAVSISMAIKPGDVVFDIGANIGKKAEEYLNQGARVVCVEPQPACVKVLRAKFGGNSHVAIVPEGVASSAGEMELAICSQANTISTFSSEWKTGRFANYRWDQKVIVPVTTLDELIRQHGLPTYCKIDVEGFEYEVLKGLSRPVPNLSFEFAIEFLENAEKCAAHLEAIGFSSFNVAFGEDPRLVFTTGVSAQELFRHLRASDNSDLWGDIYAEARVESVTGIVFSKDRAMQLEGTLHSFFNACADAADVRLTVLYRTSDQRHERQYRDLAWQFPQVEFVRERNFDHDVRRVLGRHSEILFLVDDNLFVRPFRLAEARDLLVANRNVLGVSLRLGTNTTYCYPIDRTQNIPAMAVAGAALRIFDWTVAEHDFGYPLEVSSSLYRVQDIVAALGQGRIQNPNALEAQLAGNLQAFRSSRPQLGCFVESVTFCAPLNKVQTAAPANRAGVRQEYTSEHLADLFTGGSRIDTSSYTNFIPRGCHQEVDLVLCDATDCTQCPIVSVVINCHNYEAFLRETLESVFAQTFRDFEVVVVDDGSTDQSWVIAREAIAQRAGDVPMTLLRLNDVGPSRARGMGIERSRGRYVMLLDADDRVAPEFLASTVPVLDAEARIGFAYVDTVYFGDVNRRHHQPAYDFEKLKGSNFISYCSLIRRSAFDSVGGYDPANWGYYEDWDLWIRFGEAGWFGRHVPKPLFHYRHHFSTSLSRFAQRLDPIYRAFIITRHPKLYSAATVRDAAALVAELPAGWHAGPPYRELKRIQTAIAAHPDNSHLRYFLALSLWKNEDRNAAIETLRKLIEDRPEDTLARSAWQEFSAAPATTSQRNVAVSQSDATDRTIVSVVIPCFKQAEYLPEAVESVVRQTFVEWEIVIVNDGSPDDTSEVAGDLIAANPNCRIRLVEKANGGLADARNAGIEAARGKYILPLDADDKLHPEMLARTVALLDANPAIAIAYTDWQYFGADTRVRCSIDYDFQRLCCKENLFTCSSLFRKEAWHAVGGFNRNMTHGVEDWDFWIGCGEKGFRGQRIPQVLFYYRSKPGSMIQTLQPHLNAMFARIVLNHPAIYGPNAVAKARAIFDRARLPPPKDAAPGTEWLTKSETSVDGSLRKAARLIRSREFADAIGELRSILSNATHPRHVERAQTLIALIPKPDAGASPAPVTATPETSDFFGPGEVETIERLIQTYTSHASDAAVSDQLRQLQQSVAGFVRRSELAQLEVLFRGDFGRVYRRLLGSGLQWDSTEPITSREPAQSSASGQIVSLLADILLHPAIAIDAPFAFESIPEWLREDYVDYLLGNPGVFTRQGEADRYADYRLALLRSLHARIAANPNDKIIEAVAFQVATKGNCIPLYCSSGNTRDVMEKRAALLEYILLRKGAQLNASLPKRPKNREKIKVGYLNAHFGPQTETHVALSSLRLDRSKFEIVLFALQSNPSPIENECRSLADLFVVLPQGLAQQAKVIRDAALDVLIIGTNVTAVTNGVALLAQYRLAPLQLASYCSPMSTGFRHVDGYLTGSLTNFEGAAAQFSERLVVCEGPPGCLDYSHEPAATAKFNRCALGIGDDEIVYINAAACYKIVPEVIEVWAKILRGVRNSRLLLLPFNPNWSSRFPVDRFKRAVNDALRRHGLDAGRVVMAQSLPSRADVKELEKIADIYLDTFPFSGSLSVIDPLELGLPTVVCQGESPRARAAAALLREIDVPELIATDPNGYQALAEKLGSDVGFRTGMAEKIREHMQRKPRFTDPAAYGLELARQIELLVRGGKRAPQPKKPAMQLA